MWLDPAPGREPGFSLPGAWEAGVTLAPGGGGGAMRANLSTSFRWVFLAFVSILVGALGAGCGRSGLNDYGLGDGGSPDGEVDAPADAPVDVVDGSDTGLPLEGGACNASTCPGGCCDSSGECRAGTALGACGAGGQACTDCKALGYRACDARQHVCTNPPPTCGPSTCAGCCQGNVCYAGYATQECGYGGVQCLDCAQFGDTCQNQTCVPPSVCNPQTCSYGCCEGNTCVVGTSSYACGYGGGQCQDCASFGYACQNQACSPPTGCSPTTCPYGCCQGNVCQPGTTGSACGTGGGACQYCPSPGTTCQGGYCQPSCGPNNCQGCCDANAVCQPGFLDTQCGGYGGACADCAALSPPSTCDGALSPPACTSQQTQCPGPFAGCTAPPTPAPTMPPACAPADLQNAAAACAGGASTAACTNFFNFEYSQNYSCGSCLQQFDYDFVFQQGVFACIAPFVSTTCDQNTACAYSCATQSCGQCPDPTTYDQCIQSVQNGQCAVYETPATQCEKTAYGSGGAFCDPAGYAGFGAWLQGVGTYYCGGGPVDAGAGG